MSDIEDYNEFNEKIKQHCKVVHQQNILNDQKESVEEQSDDDNKKKMIYNKKRLVDCVLEEGSDFS